MVAAFSRCIWNRGWKPFPHSLYLPFLYNQKNLFRENSFEFVAYFKHLIGDYLTFQLYTNAPKQLRYKLSSITGFIIFLNHKISAFITCDTADHGRQIVGPVVFLIFDFISPFWLKSWIICKYRLKLYIHCVKMPESYMMLNKKMIYVVLYEMQKMAV